MLIHIKERNEFYSMFRPSAEWEVLLEVGDEAYVWQCVDNNVSVEMHVKHLKSKAVDQMEDNVVKTIHQLGQNTGEILKVVKEGSIIDTSKFDPSDLDLDLFSVEGAIRDGH